MYVYVKHFGSFIFIQTFKILNKIQPKLLIENLTDIMWLYLPAIYIPSHSKSDISEGK